MDTNLSVYGLPWLLLFSFIFAWMKARRINLDHVPAIGPSGPLTRLTSYLGSFTFLGTSKDVTEEGYRKFRGGFYRIPYMFHWTVVCCNTKLIPDLRKASEDEVSFYRGIAETLQSKFTMTEELHHDRYHIAVVRSILTKKINDRFSDIRDELVQAFEDEVALVGNEWRSVQAFDTISTVVSRSSNRLFVGFPLCRDPEYLRFVLRHARDVFDVANKINRFPAFIRPIVGPWYSKISSHLKQATYFLGPIVEERLKMAEASGDNKPDMPDDLITWLIDETKGQRKDPRGLILRILSLNFASIHTTSLTFTNALYYLAANPEYLSPLREEIESIVKEEGWTKVALDRMHKVDSFLKESARLSGLGFLVMHRKIRKDFTFSDGTVLPAGTSVALPLHGFHLEEDNYPNPTVFDPFRFSNLMVQESQSTKLRMTTPDPHYLTWGQGRNTCPGRFFAVNELKAMLAHVAITYDVKFKNERVRPTNEWLLLACLPNRNAEVMFRRRAI